MQELICPYCQHNFSTEDSAGDDIFSCPQCGHRFKICFQDDTDNSGDITGKFNRSNSNILLLAINTVITIVCIGYALYLWNFRVEIHRELKQKKHKEYVKQSTDHCREKITDYGNFLLEYARNNKGELPDRGKCRDEYMKYLNVSFIAEGCPVSSNFNLHFDKLTLKNKKNSDTLLLSCPEHKFGFFADGKCRSYPKEDAK